MRGVMRRMMRRPAIIATAEDGGYRHSCARPMRRKVSDACKRGGGGRASRGRRELCRVGRRGHLGRRWWRHVAGREGRRWRRGFDVTCRKGCEIVVEMP